MHYIILFPPVIVLPIVTFVSEKNFSIRGKKNPLICCSLRIQLCSFLYCMQLFFIMCDTFTLLISVLHFSLQCSHFVFSFISCHVVCYWSDITSCRLLLFFIEQHFSLQFYTSHSSVLISCSMFSFCVLIQIGIVLRIVTLVSEKNLVSGKKTHSFIVLNEYNCVLFCIAGMQLFFICVIHHSHFSFQCLTSVCSLSYLVKVLSDVRDISFVPTLNSTADQVIMNDTEQRHALLQYLYGVNQSSSVRSICCKQND